MNKAKGNNIAYVVIGILGISFVIMMLIITVQLVKGYEGSRSYYGESIWTGYLRSEDYLGIARYEGMTRSKEEEKNTNIVSMRAIGKYYNDKATYEALVNYGADEELTAFYLERSNQDLATMGEYDYCAVKIDADIENAKCAGVK